MTMYFAFTIIDICMLLLFLYIIDNKSNIPKKPAISFKFLTLAILLFTIFEMINVISLDIDASIFFANEWLIVFLFSIAGFVPYIIFVLFSFQLSKDYKFIFLIPFINTICYLSNHWTNIMFTVQNNLYLKGVGFYFFIFTLLFGCFLILVHCIEVISMFHDNERKFLIVFSLITIACTVLPLFYVNCRLASKSSTLAIIILFIFYRESQTKYDAMTGLLNRTNFNNMMNHSKKMANKSLIMFDIDDFKLINDHHGHHIGDEYIKLCASLIQKYFAEFGLCYRIGGDEFCVIVSSIDQHLIAKTLTKLDEEIKFIKESKQTITPTISYGYTAILNAENPFSYFRLADQLMYQHKQSKKTI